MVKVLIWAYYCMNSCVTNRARSTRVLQTILYYLRVADLMGITSPYPRENIIAGNYILADMRAYLNKRHRQQNKEILIKHSPGMGEYFWVFRYSNNRKKFFIKNDLSLAVGATNFLEKIKFYK